MPFSYLQDIPNVGILKWLSILGPLLWRQEAQGQPRLYDSSSEGKGQRSPQPGTKGSHRFLSADFALGPEMGLQTQFILRAIRAFTPSPEKTKPKRGRYLPLVSNPNNVATLDPVCGTGQFSQETHVPYSSTLGARSVGHTVSQEEHQPPVPCPQCVDPRLRASSLEPRLLDTVNPESPVP